MKIQNAVNIAIFLFGFNLFCFSQTSTNQQQDLISQKITNDITKHYKNNSIRKTAIITLKNKNLRFNVDTFNVTITKQLKKNRINLLDKIRITGIIGPIELTISNRNYITRSFPEFKKYSVDTVYLIEIKGMSVKNNDATMVCIVKGYDTKTNKINHSIALKGNYPMRTDAKVAKTANQTKNKKAQITDKSTAKKDTTKSQGKTSQKITKRPVTKKPALVTKAGGPRKLSIGILFSLLPSHGAGMFYAGNKIAGAAYLAADIFFFDIGSVAFALGFPVFYLNMLQQNNTALYNETLASMGVNSDSKQLNPELTQISQVLFISGSIMIGIHLVSKIAQTVHTSIDITINNKKFAQKRNINFSPSVLVNVNSQFQPEFQFGMQIKY